MKLIKLTKGLFAQVDNSDYPWLNVWKWYAYKNGLTYYARRSTSRKDGPQKTILMHRLIMNTPDNQEVDHEDHNGLNCQRHNMRNCIHKQNTINKKSSGKSKYLGVSFCGNGKYIRADIMIDGIATYLGLFHSEIKAAERYDEMAKLHHKEFANLNFPDRNI